MKIDWQRKLSSRKFWAALGAFITALCVLLGVSELTAEKLIATVSALGVLTAYILTEGYLDGKHMGDEVGGQEKNEDRG